MRMQTGLALVALVIALALPSFGQQPFADVPADHWAAKAVADLAAVGIMEGRPDGTFDGRRAMTRYEVAVSLARLLARVEKMIPTTTGGTTTGGTTTGGVTLDQIRNMILTNPDVQAKLRGPQGDRGPAGAAGAAATVDQLRTLILNDTEVQGKLRGPQGAQGQQGGVGPKGDKGDPGLTTAQVTALNKLLTEFSPEIEAVRGDIRKLNARVDALEAAIAKINPLRTSVTGGIRGLFQGTSIGLDQDAAVVGDNLAIFNSPFADASLDKDLLKGARVAVSLFDLSMDASFSEGLAGHATLRAISPVSFDAAPYAAGGAVVPFDATQSYAAVPGGPLAGMSSYVDSIQLWDWYVTFSSEILGKGLAVTAGRQSNAVAQGLLVDTSRNPLLGVSVDTGIGPVSIGANVSAIDRISNPLTIDPAVVEDSFAYVYFGGNIADWSLVGTWLQSGFADQRGWSVAADGQLFGVHLFGEYAKLTRGATGGSPAGNTGWVVGADLINNWKGFSLTGRYGQIGAGFTPGFSVLYPYASVNAYDINWMDRPLFLDPNNVTQGWEADMKLALSKGMTLSSRVYAGTGNSDTVWTVGLKKQLTNSVATSIQYAQREVNNRATGAPITSDLKVLRVALEFLL
jgi:hypothetical protein